MARNPDLQDITKPPPPEAPAQPPTTPSQSDYNPPRKTVRKAAPKAASSGRSSGGGGGGSPAPAIDQNALAQSYGFTVAFLKAYPELNNLFNQAVSGGWTADRFTAGLKSTNWYQSMSDSQRKAVVMQYTDPATYQKTISDAEIHIRTLATQMGVDPNDWDTMGKVATRYVQEGWTDEQARNELGLHLNFSNAGLLGGQAGQTVDNLNQYAYQMGVKNSDDWVRQNVMNIVRGISTEQDAKNQIENQAIATFPQYEKQIRGGMTVESLAQPYMQSMQSILEIPSGQVNLFDPTIRNVMSYRDPSGSGQQKPLWQFQNDLRQDPRWAKTQNAQNAAMGAAHKVLQDFGIFS